MGLRERNKGRRGQRAAKTLLGDRDYVVIETNAGEAVEDLIAEKDGESWCVEVKNHKLINIPKFLAQARAQAAKRKKKWMLLCRIDGTREWLIMRQGEWSQVWRERDTEMG